MTQLQPTENAQSIRTFAGLVLLAGAISMAPPLAAVPLQTTTAMTVGSMSLWNSTATAAALALPPLPDHELESPNFAPSQLQEFAATGFVRRNRWA